LSRSFVHANPFTSAVLVPIGDLINHVTAPNTIYYFSKN
jgi:hypothetical protein